MLKPYLITAVLVISMLVNVVAQAPVINSFSPASGPVGTVVTINGSNYNTTLSSNAVFFGATKATVISAAAGKLTVSVPVGATYQPISVLNTATTLAGYSAVPFLLTFPSKNSISASDFDAPQSFSSGNGTYDGAIADLDGDGKSDVITVDNVDGAIAVFRNISPTTGAVSTASFAGHINLTTGGDPEHIVITDLNGDGLPDIIATNEFSNKISILINHSTPGNISFAPHADVVVGTAVNASAIYFITTADVNGDGRPDIIMITNSDLEKNITVLENDGTEFDFQGGPGFTSLSVGDLDNDGLPEIVITAKGLTIYHNTTSGGILNFSPMPAMVKSTTPVTASLADVDNDGKLDIIEQNPGTYADPSNGSISIYRNQSTPGNISLATNIDVTCRVTNLPILFADMDGDGLGDIIMAGYPIQILKNTTVGSNISMALPVNITPNVPPEWLGIGDINGDGKTDLIATNLVSNSFDVFQNDPQSNVVIPPAIISFAPKTAVVGATVTINGTNFNSSAAGNLVFFGAVRATVLTASATKLTVKVPAGATYKPITTTNTTTSLTGYSASAFLPTFQPGAKPANFDAKVNFNTGTAPNAIAVGDIDGDGKPDIVIANSNGNSISIYRNISAAGSITTSSFAPKIDFATPNNPVSVTIGDLNFDGKPDIVVGCAGTNSVAVFRNISASGSIAMAPIINFPENAGVSSVKIIDVDGDGKPDIVGVIQMNQIVFYRNKTVGTNVDNLSMVKDTLVISTGIGPGNLDVGDFDGDGKPDLAITIQGAIGTIGSVELYQNTTNKGTFSFARSIYPNIGYWPNALSIGDMDGDGKPDVVLTLSGAYNTNEIVVLPNTSPIGDIEFGTLSIFSTGDASSGLALGDLDGDGKPDAIVVNQNDSTASVLLNTSTIGKLAFKDRVTFPTSQSPTTLLISDLDGDGKPDMVVTGPDQNKMSVLRYDENPPPVPSIQLVTFLAGATGSPIYINGLNFTGATAVSFGGTPAQSFIVNSPTSITAVVGSGSTGVITVATPYGTAQALGFNFVPVPTIAVSGPTTFQFGGNVVLTASPVSGDIYGYQWKKDGQDIYQATSSTFTATESGNYTVVLTCLNIAQPSAQSITVNAVFNLPADNFRVAVTGATCKGSDDGSINVTAMQSLDYNVTVTNIYINKIAAFNTSATVGDLPAGSYHVCITVSGQAGYQQCFDVVIVEPKDLSVYSTINDADKNITLALSGGNNYTIQLNGQVYSTSNSTITLPLAAGNNDLSVTADKLCQGVFSKLINISGMLAPYPDPIQNTLNLNLGNKTISQVQIEIHNISTGKLVFSKGYINQSGVLQLDLSYLDNGVYTLRLNMDKTDKIFKIIKE